MASVFDVQLFDVYSQFVVQKELEGRGEGVNIEGILINNLRFARDTAIMAECEAGLQILLEGVNRESGEMGEMKFKVISENQNIKLIPQLIGEQIEQVQN